MYEAFAILLTFGLLLYLLRRKVLLGAALLAAGVFLGILARMHPLALLGLVGETLIAPATVELSLTVVLLGILGHSLKETGSLRRMVDSLQGLFPSRKLILGLIPALIGLVVVPGAAIMSAPMVGSLGDDLHYSCDRKAAINLLFRHVWFPAFPLATSLLSLAQIAGVSIYSVIPINLPAAIVGIVASSLVCIGWPGRPVGIVAAPDPLPAHPGGLAHYRRCLGEFFLSTAPILFSLVLATVSSLPFPLSLSAGISLGLGLNRVPLSRWKALLLGGLDYKIALAMAGVMVFKAMVQASGLVITLVTRLTAAGVAPWILVIGLPLLVALATGSSLAAVGIALPILLPLIAPRPDFLPLLSLFYISCCTGYFFSPLHLCLILTNDYFQAEYRKVCRLAAAPMLLMFVTSVVVSLFLWPGA